MVRKNLLKSSGLGVLLLALIVSQISPALADTDFRGTLAVYEANVLPLKNVSGEDFELKAGAYEVAMGNPRGILRLADPDRKRELQVRVPQVTVVFDGRAIVVDASFTGQPYDMVLSGTNDWISDDQDECYENQWVYLNINFESADHKVVANYNGSSIWSREYVCGGGFFPVGGPI
jgi:hypothetical protein